MQLLNPRFFTSSSSALFSLSLNPFKFPPLSAQSTLRSRNLQNRQLRSYHYRDTLCFSRSASVRAAMCTSQPSIHVKDRIDLTAKEKEIFDRLLQVLSHFSLQTQLRVAGGWVRDKRFGTAQEDAYRRDLTINSLFYNINTSSVEDFTGRGIIDLKSRKIVTPLPPKQTFLDDPLRVLRAIRFGARFGFFLDEELKEAAADNEVIAAITDKISRERIGHEIDLMIAGNEPVKAMTYISELQLFWAVFSLPPSAEPPTPEGCEKLCIAYMASAWRLLQLVGSFSINEDQQRLCLYAALLLPLRNTVYKDTKGKKIPVVSYIFRNSLKLKASDADAVLSMHLAVEKFSFLIPSIICDENLQALEDLKKETIDVPLTSKQRILIGLLLREIKDFWRPSLVLSLLLYPQDIGLIKSLANEDAELNDRRAVYHRVESAIMDMGLDKVWELKPLVDGKRIMDLLQIKSGGPIVREWNINCSNGSLLIPPDLQKNAWIG